jgi:hypothetical protein
MRATVIARNLYEQPHVAYIRSCIVLLEIVLSPIVLSSMGLTKSGPAQTLAGPRLLHQLRCYFFLATLRGVSMAAWAAASRAIGTRNGLQLT